MRFAVVTVVALSAIFSCTKDDDRYVPQEEIIRIEFDTDTSKLFADNESVLLMRAVIDPGAAEAFRTISFSSTDGLGVFEGTVSDKKNIVMADQTGTARSVIRVSNKPGTYYVSASVTSGGKTYKSFDYLVRLKPVTQDNQIRLVFESDTSSLRADNQSVINLKAIVPPNTSGEPRLVTFIATTELGTFKGTGATITASADGIAKATIQVGDKPGLYFVAAEVKQGDKTYRTADFPVQLDPVPVSEKLSLETDITKPEADGFSLVHIKAAAKYTKEKTITLTTSLGNFINSTDPKRITLSLNAEGKAETDLQVSNEVKPHIVNAVLGSDAPVVVTIVPTISYPNRVIVEPSSLSVAMGASIDLDVFLKKNDPQKLVSRNIPVTFQAYQVVNGTRVPAGRFTNTANSVSGADGSVPRVKFIADAPGLSTALPVTIEVAAPKSATEPEIVYVTIKLTS